VKRGGRAAKKQRRLGDNRRVKVFDIPKLERWLEAIDRAQPAIAAARREAERQLTEAWKKPRRESVIAGLIYAGVPAKTIAVVLRRECGIGIERRRGRPRPRSRGGGRRCSQSSTPASR
jgi:hypothetical protein